MQLKETSIDYLLHFQFDQNPMRISEYKATDKCTCQISQELYGLCINEFRFSLEQG